MVKRVKIEVHRAECPFVKPEQDETDEKGSEVLETDIESGTTLIKVTCRRFVCAVCEARAKRAVKTPGIKSDGNALGFFVALFQLLFLKPSDLLVLAFSDGGQG